MPLVTTKKCLKAYEADTPSEHSMSITWSYSGITEAAKAENAPLILQVSAGKKICQPYLSVVEAA